MSYLEKFQSSDVPHERLQRFSLAEARTAFQAMLTVDAAVVTSVEQLKHDFKNFPNALTTIVSSLLERSGIESPHPLKGKESNVYCETEWRDADDERQVLAVTFPTNVARDIFADDDTTEAERDRFRQRTTFANMNLTTGGFKEKSLFTFRYRIQPAFYGDDDSDLYISDATEGRKNVVLRMDESSTFTDFPYAAQGIQQCISILLQRDAALVQEQSRVVNPLPSSEG